jgi:hypothetical protein
MLLLSILGFDRNQYHLGGLRFHDAQKMRAILSLISAFKIPVCELPPVS